MNEKATKENVYCKKFFAMGTYCQVLLPGMNTENADHIFNVIKKMVLRLEEDLSHFKEESEISQINRIAAHRPVPVSEEVFEVLKQCRKYYDITHGVFDITQKQLQQYWIKKPYEHSLKNVEFQKLKNATGMKNVTLNERRNTVSFDNKSIKIDLSGIGKGYTVEKIKKVLRSFSVTNAFVSFGESTIGTLGSHPDGEHWKVGIQDYLNPEQTLHTFQISDGSLSTSSSFYVDEEGRLQSLRVIDPITGYPVKDLKSVSVYSDSAVLVEVLSNVFLVTTDKSIKSIVSMVGHIDTIKVTYASESAEFKRFRKKTI